MIARKHILLIVSITVVAIVIVALVWIVWGNVFSNNSQTSEDWETFCSKLDFGGRFGRSGQPPVNFDPSNMPSPPTNFDSSRVPNGNKGTFPGGGDFDVIQAFKEESESACEDGKVDSSEQARLKELMADLPEGMPGGFPQR